MAKKSDKVKFEFGEGGSLENTTFIPGCSCHKIPGDEYYCEIHGGDHWKNELPRPSILQAPCLCPKCSWSGMVYNCEPDIDGEGSLGCPECKTIVKCLEIRAISDETIEIPSSVVVCPVCNSQMLAQVNSWLLQDNYWIAQTVFIGCESEPAIIDDKWDQWYTTHDSVDIPTYNRLVDIIKQWINDNYRFTETNND